MIKSNLTPCMDWALKLSARHPDDLSSSDRLALEEHLLCCHACAEVHTAYQKMEIGIRSLLVSTPAPVLPPQHLQFAKKARIESRISLPDPITLLLSAFSSLFILISWSSFFHIIHTWLLTVLVHLPRNIAYVSSNNHFTYAIRSGSGFALWRQKRSQRHNLIPTVTIQWNGVGYIGAGIFYVSALDFCRYTARA